MSIPTYHSVLHILLNHKTEEKEMEGNQTDGSQYCYIPIGRNSYLSLETRLYARKKKSEIICNHALGKVQNMHCKVRNSTQVQTVLKYNVPTLKGSQTFPCVRILLEQIFYLEETMNSI